MGSIIESGRRLAADLSADLLKTIFWPGSALHDLGVVVQRGRVAAAACQFPLAESDELHPTVGGRHRAAAGLSNDSDAVVLVVSEETGAISIAERGQLQQGLALPNLREALLELLAPGAKGAAA